MELARHETRASPGIDTAAANQGFGAVDGGLCLSDHEKNNTLCISLVNTQSIKSEQKKPRLARLLINKEKLTYQLFLLRWFWL